MHTVAADKLFDGSVSLHTSVTNNALKTQHQKEQEQQHVLNLNVLWDHQEKNTDAKINYRFNRYYFTKKTQQNKSILEGDSHLRFADDGQYSAIFFGHSQRSLLNNIDDANLVENKDERQILTLRPEFKVRSSKVDDLILSFTGEDISYRYAENLDSTRLTSLFLWQHILSKVDTMRLRVTAADIRFDQQAQNDYRSYKLLIGKDTTLRNLSYKIDIGADHLQRQTGEEEESDTKLNYKVQMHIMQSRHQWDVQLERFVTDSSLGSGNSFDFEGLDSDVVADDIFLYEIYRGQVSWAYSGLCDGCDLAYHFIYLLQKHENTIDKTLELNHGINGQYFLSNVSSIQAGMNYRDQRLESGTVLSTGFKMIDIQLNYQHQFMKKMHMNMGTKYENRNDIRYKEWRVYLGIKYAY